MNKSESFNKNYRKHLLSVHNELQEDLNTADQSPSLVTYSNDNNILSVTNKQREMILDGKTVSIFFRIIIISKSTLFFILFIIRLIQHKKGVDTG